ncbi:hypothetical protein PG988_007244 [Apiospora saccharicola]
MSLESCPNEIVHRVLYYSILTRGLRRGLRLKLVSKFFYNALQPALFEARVLDTIASDPYYGPSAIFQQHSARNYKGNGPHKLWHAYAVMRVTTDHDPSISRCAHIRHVATVLSKRTGQSLAKTIAELCWFAEGQWFEAASSDPVDEAPKPISDLLSAATYFGDKPLVLELLGNLPVFLDDRNLLPSPMYMAAYTGNKELLLLFQERVPEWVGQGRVKQCDDPEWRGKITRGSMHGAARRGEMDILLLAMNPPSSKIKDFRDNDELRAAVWYASLGCIPPNIETFEYFRSAVGNGYYGVDIATYAALGHMSMVRHCLDNGADPQGDMAPGRSPLSQAVRHCHWEVVELLLERGAKIQFWAPLQDIAMSTQKRRLSSSVVVAAVQSGSLSMVRRLFERGAVLEYTRYQRTLFAGHLALSRAVELEHTAMIEFLLEKGAGDLFLPFFRRVLWNREERKWPLTKAFSLGLDSMVHVLRRNGITRESIDKDRWIIWHFD